MVITVRKKGPLDRLGHGLQALILLAAPSVLAWVGTEGLPALREQYGATTAGAVALAFASLLLTTLTRKFGRGAGATEVTVMPSGGSPAANALACPEVERAAGRGASPSA